MFSADNPTDLILFQKNHTENVLVSHIFNNSLAGDHAVETVFTQKCIG